MSAGSDMFFLKESISIYSWSEYENKVDKYSVIAISKWARIQEDF